MRPEGVDDRGRRLALRPGVVVVVLWAAAAVALALQVVAIGAHSLTGDGAYHLLAGHQAQRYGQNTVNLEHPPLVKLVAAIPAWLEATPLTPPVRPPGVLQVAERMHRQADLVRRATIGGRVLVLVVFDLPFLVACWWLGRRLGPPLAGPVLALMVALSFSVLANLTILQTDTAAALVFVLTILCGLRLIERPTVANAAILGAVWGFGLSVKFSAVLLGPTIVAALLIALVPVGGDPWPSRLRRGLGHGLVMGVVALAVLHVTYLAANRHYDPEVGRAVIEAHCENRSTLIVEDRLEPLEGALLRLERFDPYLAQWVTGLVGMRAQNAIGVYPSYAFGRVSSAGRWWYHPVVLLIKTPLAVMAAAIVLLAGWLRRRSREGVEPLPDRHRPSLDGPHGWRARLRAWAPWILIWTTAGVYLGMAMLSNYNLGYRHLIPIVPLLYLPIARGVARRGWAAALLVGVLAAESLALTPFWMSATNTWWLGAHNPTRFVLSAGNLEYRQNFVQLARESERRGLDHLNVVYLVLSPDIVRAYLPDAHTVVAGEDLKPGWYAVNVMAEQYVPALLRDDIDYLYDQDGLRAYAQRWAPTLEHIQQGEAHGYIAGTFHLYRLEE